MANRMLGIKPVKNCKWCGKKLGVFIVRGKFCCFTCAEKYKERKKKNVGI